MPGISLRGIVFLAIATVTAYIGSVVLLPMAFLIFPKKLYQKASYVVSSNWFALIASVLELVFGIHVYTDIPEDIEINGNNTLVVSNHRTRLDWMFLWCLFARRPQLLRNLKIVLKDPLRKAPLFGWAMRHFGFLFLKRELAADEKHIVSTCRAYRDEPVPFTLLMFPEGTDLSESNVKKSIEYATKSNLPVYHNVLLPRSNGMYLVAKEFAAGGGVVSSVLDVTMGYIDYTVGERPSEQCLLDGRTPRAIHFHCRSVPLSTIVGANPPTLEHTTQWLSTSFAAKEAQLEQFYHRDPMGFVPPMAASAVPWGLYVGSWLFWLSTGYASYAMAKYAVTWWVSLLWVVGVIALYIYGNSSKQ
eukprot:PhF_6_TR38117/c0_g1_i2/m.56892/K13513/LCLAT1, AGPAT8; lysocardiolipin and lysophospholipid acyltransferase